MRSMEVAEEVKFKPVALVFETQEECDLFCVMMSYDMSIPAMMDEAYNSIRVNRFMREARDAVYAALAKQKCQPITQ